MLKLTLVTPEKKLVIDQEIDFVSLPGFKGELNILPGHSPLLTTVEPGVVKFKTKAGETVQAAVGVGYCQVFTDGVNIMVETAETAKEIDAQRSQKALEEVNKALATQTLNDQDYKDALSKRARAQARLSIIQK